MSLFLWKSSLNLSNLIFLPHWVRPWTQPSRHEVILKVPLGRSIWNLFNSSSSPSVEAHACTVDWVALYDRLGCASGPTSILFILPADRHTAQRSPLPIPPLLRVLRAPEKASLPALTISSSNRLLCLSFPPDCVLSEQETCLMIHYGPNIFPSVWYMVDE